MRLDCTVPHISEYMAICSAFTFFFFSNPHSFKCGFSGAGLRSVVPLSAKASAAFGWWDTRHRMWHAASLRAGVMLVLFTPSEGKSWRGRGLIHIKRILLFQFCSYFCLAFCSLLSLALCPAGTLKQAGGSCLARGHLHLLPHALAVAFGFVQDPLKTTLPVSLVLQTHSLIKMLSWSLGDVGLFLCKHSRLL